MRGGQRIAVIIPALDEEAAIAGVLTAIPAWVDQRIVVDNGSRDRTARFARDAGAEVVSEPNRGYGAACLAGVAAVGAADILVFLDGDGSDRPQEMSRLIDPILTGKVAFVVGSRVLGGAEPGALSPPQRAGNWLACLLMGWRFGACFSDLGPFRAIRREALLELKMADRDFGWTVEMQVKALRRHLSAMEVPVSYRRRRGGRSKVSGNLVGMVRAGWKILTVIGQATVKPAA